MEVEFYGSHAHYLGYGYLGKCVEKALKDKGVKVNPGHPCRQILYISLPTAIKPWYEGQEVACFTMWETDTLPEGFLDALDERMTYVVPCEHNKRLFEGTGHRANVIPFGVYEEEWGYVERHKGTPFYILCVAASAPIRKGVDLLTRAFREVFWNRPEVQLIIKSYKPAYGRRVINVTQRLTQKELCDLYGRSHIYVMPSRGEGFSLTPLEAMATGLPTIVSDNTGMSDYAHLCWSLPCEKGAASYFVLGESGNWYEPDYNALCANLKWIYDNYEEALEKARVSSETVRATYTWDRVADMFIDLLGGQMSKPASGVNKKKEIKPKRGLYWVEVAKDVKLEQAGIPFEFKKGQKVQVSRPMKAILAQGGYLNNLFACPLCLREFETEEEKIEHIQTTHRPNLTTVNMSQEKQLDLMRGAKP